MERGARLFKLIFIPNNLLRKDLENVTVKSYSMKTKPVILFDLLSNKTKLLPRFSPKMTGCKFVMTT